MWRVGLNAQLLSLGESYRGAGVSRYIHKLLTYLPQVDSRLSYVAFLGDAHAHFPGWKHCVSRWPTENPVVRIVWEQIVQPWEAWREKLSLLHAPVYVGPIAAPCPIVVTVHDLSFVVHPNLFRPFNRVYLQRLTRRSVDQAVAIIADSQSTKNDLVQTLGVSEGKITVIHPGVAHNMQPIDDRQLQDFRRSRGLPEHMILFLGTLEPRKNLPTLLQAYAIMHKKPNLNRCLVIAGGKGWYYDEIYAQVERLGLRDEVIFPGYVPETELPLWYNAADLFVYPSLYEGFGMPPLEAMACGTPVVVSNTSSLPEVVGDAALTVDPQDPQALADAMLEALHDPQTHQRLREAGPARAGHYTWADTAARTARLYHQVLGDEQTDES